MSTVPFTHYDLLQSQQPDQIVSSLFMNLMQSKRFLLEAESAYNGDYSQRGFATADFQTAFRHLSRFTDNFLKMIVDAYTARLIVQGFAVGTDEVEGLVNPSDELAWQIWRVNRMDQAVSLAHREAMKFGNAYVLVDPFTTVNGMPRMTVETPFQVSVYQDPSDRYANAAAIKHWQSADGFFYCNLYTADWCVKYQSSKAYTDWSEAGMFIRQPAPEEISWVPVDEFEHDLGVCPVVTIENQPTLTRGGSSDLELLLPLQRAIDNLCRNMLVASEYAAWPQKYAIGLEPPKDANGNVMRQEAIEASLSRFWAVPPTSSDEHPPSLGTFAAADLTNYVAAMQQIINDMTTVSSVPGYRLMNNFGNMSASAMIAAEAGFIDVCRQKQVDYGAGWTSAMCLAMNAYGQQTTIDDVTIVWKDPSAVNGANLAASLVALQAIGVPQPVLWSMMGASPEETARWQLYNDVNPAPDTAQPAGGENDPVAAAAIKHLTSQSGANGNAAADGTDDELAGLAYQYLEKSE